MAEIPTNEDPRWKEWTDPVLAFLDTPRDLDAIYAFAKESGMSAKMLVCCLAWLNDKRLAIWVDREEGEKVRWVAYRSAFRPMEMPDDVALPDNGSIDNVELNASEPQDNDPEHHQDQGQEPEQGQEGLAKVS